MRILAASDLHCDLAATRAVVAAARDADVVIIAGDIANEGQGAEPLLALLRQIPRPVLLVAGNHDRPAALRAFCADWQMGHFLHGEAIRLQGQVFFGLGAEIPRHNDAVWNFALSETNAARALEPCPPGAVLITHSPPWQVCDRQKDGTHNGARAVMDTLRARAPRLHLCGHVHNAWGQRAQVGETLVCNLGPTVNWFDI